MYSVLVANANSEQRESYCQFLIHNCSNLNVIGVDSGTKALNTYNEINPNVFVLDSKFLDLSSKEIIAKLSSTKKESKNCNIILTANLDEAISIVSNTEKIYKILFKPFDFSELKVSIQDICLDTKIPELDNLQLHLFLLDLKFNINSPSTKYLIEAIHQCYYYPHLLRNLDEIIKIISYKYNVSEKTIRFSFRNALKPINNYRSTITQSSFINLFDPMRNITPKYFLDIITTYLHKQNRTDYNDYKRTSKC